MPEQFISPSPTRRLEMVGFGRSPPSTPRGGIRHIPRSGGSSPRIIDYDGYDVPPRYRSVDHHDINPSKIRTGTARPAADMDWEDPVLHQPVPRNEAYYLNVNARDGKVHHVYSLAALELLKRHGHMKSPITRNPYSEKNYRKLK